MTKSKSSVRFLKARTPSPLVSFSRYDGFFGVSAPSILDDIGGSPFGLVYANQLFN